MLAFANSPDLAARDVKQFGDEFGGQFGYIDAISYFARSSKETGNDYLLAFLHSTQVVKVTCGTAEKVVGESDVGRRSQSFHAI